MSMRLPPRPWLAVLAAAACGLALAPQGAAAQDKVLRGPQVTEAALIDALRIDGPAVPEDAVRRGFGPPSRALTGRPSAARAGKASLLITFATNSTELTDEARALLDVVARAAQSDELIGFGFIVEGHADPRGGAEFNQRLSQGRAEAVVRYLVTQHGVLPQRLQPLGRGATQLLDTAWPEAPENRRVTIVTQRP